jgi:arylsulfate sulfotransferase
MRRLNCSFRPSDWVAVLLPVLFVVFISSISCRKIGKTLESSPGDSTHVDTVLTQDIYTLDSFSTPTPGTILSTPFNESILPTVDSPGLLLVMDQGGRVLQKKVTAGTAFCLNRWTINGQTRYSYILNDALALRLYSVDQNAGYAIIADSNYNTIKEVDFTPYGNSLFLFGQALDVHDFILVSDNDFITLAYDVKIVKNIPAYLHPATTGVPVVAPIIEEVNNGAVVWSWDGSADTSFYANSVGGNNYQDSVSGQDYIHMNSMFVDPRDNNLICSMRVQNQIIKINRQTGAIMWRLGGKNSDFALDSTQVFLGQHHATLTDNNQTLLIFDDGDPKLRPYSRIDEFQLDEANKVVTGFKSFNIPEPFSELMGSVQKSGNEYFIGGGTGNYMLEINYVTGQKIMEFKGNKTTYRAYKY